MYVKTFVAQELHKLIEKSHFASHKCFKSVCSCSNAVNVLKKHLLIESATGDFIIN